MLHRLALLSSLVATAALAQAFGQVTQLGQATQACPSCPPYGAGAVSAFQYLPTALSGPLIPEDGNTVMHCYGSDFNGTTLTCTRGGAWTTNGSVTGAATPPLYPNGFAASARSAMGPFSASNYFSLGTGNDVLDFAGSYTLCVVFSYSTLASQYLVSDGAANSAGWVMQAGSGADGKFYFQQAKAGATVNTSPANTMAAGTVNIACGGTDGVNDFAMLNAGTVATNAIASPLTPATSAILTLGNSNTVLPFSGTIYEIYATTTAPTAGLMTSIEQTALTELGTRGELMTFTRASSANYTANGVVYSSSPGTPSLDNNGIHAENSITNGILWSRDLTNVAWTATNATTAHTATGTDGLANTATTVTATAANATVLQTVTTASQHRASSMYLRRRTGTGIVNVTKDNGVTWTAFAVNGSWQRATPDTNANLDSTSANPTTGIQIVTIGDAVDVDRVSDECCATGIATTPIDTQGTAVTRSATSIFFNNPLAGLASQPFCFGATIVPDAFWTTFLLRDLAVFGTQATANSFRVILNSNTAICDLWDGSNNNLNDNVTNVFGVGNSTPHRLTCCNPGAGVLRMYVDGSPVTDVLTGTGTMMSSQPATFQIGGGPGGFFVYGSESKVCIGKGSSVCK